MKKRDLTKQKIMKAGVVLWKKDPTLLTARNIAALIKDMTHQTVLYYYPNADALRDAVAEYAVLHGDTRIIVQLIAINHKTIKKMSKTDRAKHLNSL